MNSLQLRAVVCLPIALAVVTASSTARAASPGYWVDARAVTSSMPGAGATYVNPLFGETAIHAIHDPAALQWVYNGNQTLYSDAEAGGWTEIGAMVGRAHALAQRVLANNFPPGVTAASQSRFGDRFVVESATLPKGAPVTLTFRVAMAVDYSGAGLHDGKASCNLQVGAGTGTAQWSAATDKPTSDATDPLVIVKTTVGTRLSVTGRLDTFARASFFVPGPRYSGEMTLDATCDTPLVASSADVTLVSESGVDYTQL